MINSDPASEWELKRKSHGIFVQFLKRFDKCGKAFSVIRFVCTEDAVKAFFGVKGNPGKLSAVIV